MKKYSYYHLKKNGKDLSLQRSVIILENLHHKSILSKNQISLESSNILSQMKIPSILSMKPVKKEVSKTLNLFYFKPKLHA